MENCCLNLEEALKTKCTCINRFAQLLLEKGPLFPTPLMEQTSQPFDEFVFDQLSCFRGLQDERGWTALMFAVDNYNLDAVRYLAKFETGKCNDWGFTALAMSCYSCFEEAVPELITESFIKDLNSVSIAQQAIKNGHVDVLITLYDLLGPDCLANQDSLGRDCFAYAAYAGSDYVLEFLNGKTAHISDLFGRDFSYYLSLGRIDRADFSNYEMDVQQLLK